MAAVSGNGTPTRLSCGVIFREGEGVLHCYVKNCDAREIVNVSRASSASVDACLCEGAVLPNRVRQVSAVGESLVGPEMTGRTHVRNVFFLPSPSVRVSKRATFHTPSCALKLNQDYPLPLRRNMLARAMDSHFWRDSIFPGVVTKSTRCWPSSFRILLKRALIDSPTVDGDITGAFRRIAKLTSRNTARRIHVGSHTKIAFAKN